MYPEEKLSELQQDCSKHEGPPAPRWMRDMILYSIYIRDFSPEGTFTGAIKNLDRIRNLGATDVWLMPIHPIGIEGRKGELGCPYAIRDYMKVNPEYGTDEEFKAFIKEVHRRGMHIFIDMVANHVSNDNVNIKTHPEWFYKDAAGNFTRRVEEWSDVTDNNYSNPGLWKFMKQVLTYWVTEFDIDGFRCDVAGMVPVEFWDEITAELQKIKPELYMVAEWDGRPPLCVNAFQSDYQGEIYNLLKYNASRWGGAAKVPELYVSLRKLYPRNYLPLNFVENHDQQPAVKVMGPEGYKPWAGFTFTVPGIPLVYNGQELGHENYYSLFDRDTIQWDNCKKDVYDYYAGLITFRKAHIATRDGEVVNFTVNNPEMSAAYGIRHPEENLVCVLNYSSVPREVKVQLAAGFPEQEKVLFPAEFKPEKLAVGHGEITISMPPYSFVVMG